MRIVYKTAKEEKKIIAIIIIIIYKTSYALFNCSPPMTSIERPFPSSGICLPANCTLYTDYDVKRQGILLWPTWVSCSGFAPSQCLVHLAEDGKLKSP